MYVHVVADVVRMRIQYIQEKDHMFTGASLSNWYLLMTCLFEFIKLQDQENTACQSKSRTERKPKKKSIAFQRSAISEAI